MKVNYEFHKKDLHTVAYHWWGGEEIKEEYMQPTIF